jgi:hypothetical protein
MLLLISFSKIMPCLLASMFNAANRPMPDKKQMIGKMKLMRKNRRGNIRSENEIDEEE